MARNIYLNMKPLAEARRIVRDRLLPLRRLSTETVPVPQAVGRVLAEPVFARASAPSYHAAAMDGIAVKAEDTYGASESQPKDARGRPGGVFRQHRQRPARRDRRRHHDRERPDPRRRAARVIEAPAFPWQHVRRIGEDIVATELLFPRRHRVSPYCVGALLTGGLFTRPGAHAAARAHHPDRLRAGRLARPAGRTAAGPVRCSKSIPTVLAALVTRGGTAVRHERLPDDTARIRRAIGRRRPRAATRCSSWAAPRPGPRTTRGGGRASWARSSCTGSPSCRASRRWSGRSAEARLRDPRLPGVGDHRLRAAGAAAARAACWPSRRRPARR